MRKRTDFNWKYFLKHIAIIAVPVALQNLLTTTGSMVDTMMLASLGEKTVGAVGLCAQFSSLMFAGYWGFVGGGMMFFSQYWGAKDEEGITRSYGLTLSLMMAVGLIFACLAVMAPEIVMNIYTDKEEIQRIGITYLRVVGFAYPLQVVAMAMSALLRSIERVKIPLYGGIASVFANCFFNYLLIFGKLGLPRMGASGAALGTVLAGIVNLCVILVFVLKKKIPFILAFSKHFRWNREFVRQYLQKCFPILCNEVMIGVGNMMINIVLGHQSEQAIAAVAVFRTLEGLVIAFFSGFANAATILIGKEVGAGNHEVAFQRAKRLIYLCSGFIGIACVAIIGIHDPLLHAMGLRNESFRIGTGMLIIYSVAAVLRMGNWAQNDTYRSAGDAAFGSIMEITFMYLLVLPCVYGANYGFHAPFLVVFALCYVDEPIRYIIMQCHMYSGKWIKPVSNAGMATIEEFRRNHKIKKKISSPGQEDPLAGLKLVWLGSSVTYGDQSHGYTMAEEMEKNHKGMVCRKYAVSGTTLVNEDASSYVERIKEIPKEGNPDLIIVQLSTNDATQKKPLGVLSDNRDKEAFDDTTVIGAIEYIIAYAKETWGCPVVFYTGTYFENQEYEAMVHALWEIGKKWGIGILDLWNDEEMRGLYGTEQYHRYMGDAIHPLREGYVSWWTPKFEQYLKTFVKEISF